MKKNKMVYLAFIIPVIVLLLIYGFNGMYPFGDKSVLTVDMKGQYIAFFNAYKNMFASTSGMLYSFSKTLGGDMYGLFCYYLMSPFNLLLLFFNRLTLTDGIMIINLLKIGCASLTAYIYFSRTFKKNVTSLIFAIIYSLMAYNIVYSQNIMWLDGVILLPLVFLGIDRMINNKPALFYITVTLAIITNYYIGYMTLIGSLLYYVYKLYISNIKITKKKIVNFIKYVLLSVASSMFVLLPSVFSLLSGKASGGLSEFVPKQTYATLDFISRFCLGNFKVTDLQAGAPNLFVSLLVVVLVVIFFTNKKINKKEKTATAILLGIFVLSFLLYPLDIVWHAFAHPAGFPARYAFIFDFVLLIIAYRSYLHLNTNKKETLYKILFGGIILVLLIEKLMYTSNLYYKYYASIIFIAIYVFYLIKGKKFNYVLLLIVVFEMGLNSFLIVNNLEYEKRSDYQEFVSDYGDIVDSIKAYDESFYRLEKDYNYTTNDPLLLNYNGISHFSSVYDGSNNSLLGDYLGIFNRFYITSYLGSTPATNSLFNIKYLISDNNLSYYRKLSTSDTHNVYYNNYYLPFGFIINDIESLELKQQEPFENQNKIYSYMSGIASNVFMKNNNTIVSYDNVMEDEDKKGRYDKISTSKAGYIVYHVSVENSGVLYGYLASNKNKKVDILLNGKSIIDINDQNSYRYNVLELGEYKFGDVLELRVELLDDYTYIDDYMFYTFNENNFVAMINKLDDYPYEITEYKDGYLKGKVTSNGGMLYTSLPYNDGWNVYIDGVKTSKIKLLNTLTGVNLSSGYHVVEFRYMPKGLIVGCIISVLAVGLTIIFVNKKKEDD